MAKQLREVFLTTLLSELISKYTHWRIDDHYKIEWRGQPHSFWPESDIIIDSPAGRFIVEYDEDSDPGRSLIKYWPVIQEMKMPPLTLIEIWKGGSTIGQGYAELAKWIGVKLMELYPMFSYNFIERTDETARIIAKEVAQIIEASATQKES